MKAFIRNILVKATKNLSSNIFLKRVSLNFHQDSFLKTFPNKSFRELSSRLFFERLLHKFVLHQRKAIFFTVCSNVNDIIEITIFASTFWASTHGLKLVTF